VFNHALILSLSLMSPPPTTCSMPSIILVIAQLPTMSILDPQLEVAPFYKSCGFQEVGLPFREAGIKHIKMRKQL
jgi:hypothetical protein